MNEFFAWHNLIFYISLLIGILLIFVSTMGVGDADADVDHDIGVNTDTDLFIRVLSVLGVGKCPLSIIMFSFFLIFGGAGIMLNVIIPPAIALVSVAGAGFAALTLIKIVATTVAKLMPNTESYNVDKESLKGSYAEVTMKVSSDFGICHVKDKYGSLHKINARSYQKDGEEEKTFPVGMEVLIIDRKDDVYYVEDPQEMK